MAACRSPPAGTRTVAPSEGVADTAVATVARGSSGGTAVTPLGGGCVVAVTVTTADPLRPSTVAVTVAVPADTAVTTLPEIVATDEGATVHANARPEMGCPAASRAVAMACVVWPTATVAEASVTRTDATTACVTVTVALPCTPSLVAVIVAVPAPTAVTRPSDETVATCAFDDVQPNVRP